MKKRKLRAKKDDGKSKVKSKVTIKDLGSKKAVKGGGGKAGLAGDV